VLLIIGTSIVFSSTVLLGLLWCTYVVNVL